MINSALILGREARWAEFMSPRARRCAISNFLKENMTAVKNLAEYLAPGELVDVSDLKAGHGAIVRQGMSKIAAYRDPSGSYMRALPLARMWAATCTGIPSRRAGIAPVTVSLRHRWHAAQCSRHRPSGRGEHQDALRGIRRRRSRRRTADFTPFGDLNRLDMTTAQLAATFGTRHALGEPPCCIIPVPPSPAAAAHAGPHGQDAADPRSRRNTYKGAGR